MSSSSSSPGVASGTFSLDTPTAIAFLDESGAISHDRFFAVVRVRIHPDNPDESIEFEVSEDRILLDAA